MSTDRLDFVQLQALLAVANTGSFTLAAQRLFRTQSAVSMQVHKLEQATGILLFERHTRHVQITKEGEILRDYARQLLALEREAREALEQPTIQGIVRIGIPDDYARWLLPHVLSRFNRAYPEVQLEVVGALSTELMRLYKSDALDVALVTRQPGQVEGETIFRGPLVWVASATNVPDLQDPLPLALFPEGCVFRALTLQILADSGRTWRISHTSQSFAGGEIAVDAGCAITVTLDAIVPTRWRILTCADGLPMLPSVDVQLCYDQRRSGRATKCLVRYVKDYTANLQHAWSMRPSRQVGTSLIST